MDELMIDCPYCGESYTTLVDASAGDQDYIEDCEVCCRPIEIHLEITVDGLVLYARRDDD